MPNAEQGNEREVVFLLSQSHTPRGARQFPALLDKPDSGTLRRSSFVNAIKDGPYIYVRMAQPWEAVLAASIVFGRSCSSCPLHSMVSRCCEHKTSLLRLRRPDSRVQAIRRVGLSYGVALPGLSSSGVRRDASHAEVQ